MTKRKPNSAINYVDPLHPNNLSKGYGRGLIIINPLQIFTLVNLGDLNKSGTSTLPLATIEPVQADLVIETL